MVAPDSSARITDWVMDGRLRQCQRGAVVGKVVGQPVASRRWRWTCAAASSYDIANSLKLPGVQDVRSALAFLAVSVGLWLSVLWPASPGSRPSTRALSGSVLSAYYNASTYISFVLYAAAVGCAQ